ncbi:ammonium transporter [Ralstonia solanacearum]|uniref:Ammonium transporter n=2 Tax=Ralstonia solanacearum TaxID=305 RepID=A0AAW5ZI80_RALSL|nr:ammonium transporter [Ralstonia solanacearum]MBB6592192.1 ammonium transporter [Ralstonia solanacearum]MBB6596415.1 ammonium transporter [Ralstonia solanacearum]MDB0541513.1 ammonium transporter [Ralstonia solanacearum]MDB0552850.1 ammonium transporter [Ralstonia solanacearum]MDB0556462.1 ammonium transporter [Ralstonia solanacearum]
MKTWFTRFLTAGAVAAVLAGAVISAPAMAQDKPAASAPAAEASAPAAAAAASEPAAASSAAAAPAAAATAPAAAPAAATPVPNKGDTAWLLISTAFVILMTLPGLALFYGGLVRKKNMLSILMQCTGIFSLIMILWAVYGYSIAFTEGNAFFGGLDRLFLKGLTPDSVAATFSKGVVVPEYAYFAFQGAFAAITCALIIGAFAERAKFSAVLVFVVLWFTFAYLPIAHMVWFWPGPDGFTDAKAAEALTAKGGWLFQKGALDFAGGTVVHINAAVAGLVGAFLFGKRIGFGREALKPHSLTLTMVGASLLWFGWFGFNAGSALEANGSAALAFVNTLLATAAAVLSWSFGEWIGKSKPSMLGAASGAVAGLVAITPAAGFVGPMGAIALGIIAGLLCLWGVNGLKRMLGMDDTLDVFGVHGVGGILGALLTGVFASPSFGGTGVYDYVANKVGDYSIGSQLWIQAQGVLTTIVWSSVVAFIAYKIVDAVIGLRVPEEEEREGLDITSHGETAYED